MPGKDRKNWKNAWNYFISIGLIPKDYDKNEYCLHHIDANLKKTDRARYDEWRIEDLVPMLKSEHTRFHQKGIKRSKEYCEKLSERMKGHTLSAETRKKLSETQKGRKNPKTSAGLKEYYKNHHPWNFGKRTKVKVKRIRGEAVKEYKWFNNGIKNVRCKECPEGFKKGRLPFKHKLV